MNFINESQIIETSCILQVINFHIYYYSSNLWEILHIAGFFLEKLSRKRENNSIAVIFSSDVNNPLLITPDDIDKLDINLIENSRDIENLLDAAKIIVNEVGDEYLIGVILY